MNESLQIRSSAKTDIGSTRKNNEDRFVCDDSIRLYVVADGLGGHAAGEVAAEIAVASVTEFIRSGQKRIDSSSGGRAEVQFLKEFAQAAVEHAAASVYRMRNENVRFNGMGTTLAMLLVAEQYVVIAHIGDSRVYRIRGGDVQRLTRDHTLRAMMIEDGMDPDAISKRYDHVLVRSIGNQKRPEIDVRVERLLDQDRFLICSDGLSNQFTEQELSAVIDDEQNLETVVENLILVGKLAGGGDNLTAVLVQAASILPSNKPLTIVDWLSACFQQNSRHAIGGVNR